MFELSIQETEYADHGMELSLEVINKGFDALICHEFEKMRSQGFLSYVKLILESFCNFKTKAFTIKRK